MRRYSDNFPLVLIGGVFGLAWIVKSVYEDAFKAWVLTRLSQWGYGSEAAAVISGFVEIAPAFGGAVAIVWLLHWYIRREFERTNLSFNRKLQPPAGDFGFYTAYLSVMNTSPTEKLRDCRCEIVELRDEHGELIETHVGLRTKNQENKDKQGRFNLDQGADKEIPIFDIDQSEDDDGLSVINADGRDIRLTHGIYTAKVRGYGDRGEADEITVRLNTNNCVFDILPSQQRGERH